MRRRDDPGLSDWIFPIVFIGVVLYLIGNANDTDVGAELCPRGSHFCWMYQ